MTPVDPDDFRSMFARRFAEAPASFSLIAGWTQRSGSLFFCADAGLAALEPVLGTLFTDQWPAAQDGALLAEAERRLARPPTKLISTLPEVRRIAACAAALFGRRAREAMHTGCYRLAELRPFTRKGHLREARMEDIPLLQDWDEAMALDAKLGQTEASLLRGLTQKAVERGQRRIWDDDGPRGTLGFLPIGDAYRISRVYTPPQYRGQHYARAAVAALCNELLGKGGAGTLISLYADLDNPVSNRVYRGIGFVLEGEQLSIELE